MIRLALAETDTARSQTVVSTTPDPEQGWPNRDGRHVFDVVGRDWFRAFRITVEVVDVDEHRDFVDPRVWTERENRALRLAEAVDAGLERVQRERERLAGLPTLEEWAEGKP